MSGVKITVRWGNEVETSVHLTPRNWAKVKAGKPLQVHGKGYWYEGERFQDYWNFSGGTLVVTYGDEGAGGFDGMLREAKIE